MRQQQSRNKEKLPRQEKNQPKKNKMYVWENDYTQIFRQKKSIFILSHVLLSYSHKVTMHETHETESYRMSLYRKISKTIKVKITFKRPFLARKFKYLGSSKTQMFKSLSFIFDNSRSWIPKAMEWNPKHKKC